MKSTNLLHPLQTTPDVSILMTAFNTGRYVAEAIESILHQQTSRSWELLFVDDGSTDNTLAIAESFARQHPTRMRMLRHPGGANRGISSSRNLALQHARAGLVAFLDSDDVWLPHHLQMLTQQMERLPQVAMVFAGAERWVDFQAPFDETAARAASWGSNYLPAMLPAGVPFGVLPQGELLRWFLADESLVPCICSVMVRTTAARAVGGFCEAFRGLYDDQTFHARIVLRYEVAACNLCVARYRQYSESCCGSTRQNPAAESACRSHFHSFLAQLLPANEGVEANA